MGGGVMVEAAVGWGAGVSGGVVQPLCNVSADRRLTWERKGGLVLLSLLERVGAELEIDRVVELALLDFRDVLNQLRRYTKADVLKRKTDLEVFPAKDFFLLPQEAADRARLAVQLVDGPTFRELAGERGLNVDRALGRFPERQSYQVEKPRKVRFT